MGGGGGWQTDSQTDRDRNRERQRQRQSYKGHRQITMRQTDSERDRKTACFDITTLTGLELSNFPTKKSTMANSITNSNNSYDHDGRDQVAFDYDADDSYEASAMVTLEIKRYKDETTPFMMRMRMMIARAAVRQSLLLSSFAGDCTHI